MLPGEPLRAVMRYWPSGVAVLTSTFEGHPHGMTVSSFASISVDPPRVTVTLAADTRTHRWVQQSGIFGLSILSEDQEHISRRFSGHDSAPLHASGDGQRFAGIETFTLLTGAPLIGGSLAWLDCRVEFTYPMPHSTLFIGEVVATLTHRDGAPGVHITEDVTPSSERPLLYLNRAYHRIFHE